MFAPVSFFLGVDDLCASETSAILAASVLSGGARLRRLRAFLAKVIWLSRWACGRELSPVDPPSNSDHTTEVIQPGYIAR